MTMPEPNFANIIAVVIIGYGFVLFSDLLKQAMNILTFDQKFHFRFREDSYNRYHRKK